MDSSREQVKILHLQGLTNIQIRQKLSHLKLSRLFVYRTIKRYEETGTIVPKKKPGKKRTVRTPAVIKAVKERIRRNPARSGRKMAREMNMSHFAMQSILKKDLGNKPYKKQKIHGLTSKNIADRVARSRLLLKTHAGHNIIFSDEKLFTLEAPLNKQNDRVYGASLRDIPADKRAVERYQNASSVMVWGAISTKGKLPLLFIDKGVKINKEYYLEHVLQGHLKPYAKKLFGNDSFCFQQDSAPAHKASIVQEWCKEHLPCFISASEWPAASPDLNPLDFSTWGYMLGKLGEVKHLNLDGFKRRLLKIWDEMPDEVVRAACNDFKQRLRAVIKCKGERFEIN